MEIVVTINDLLMFWTRWDLHKDAFSRIMNCNTQSDSGSYLWEEGDFCPVLPLGFSDLPSRLLGYGINGLRIEKTSALAAPNAVPGIFLGRLWSKLESD